MHSGKSNDVSPTLVKITKFISLYLKASKINALSLVSTSPQIIGAWNIWPNSFAGATSSTNSNI